MPNRTLVSTDLLARNLGTWVVVDCRYDLRQENWGLDQYLQAHVPTAVYVSLGRDLSSPPGPGTGRHPLPPVETFAATLGRLGIDGSTQVVAYDQDAGMYASRFWWMLRYVGHEAVAVLDGGWARWTAEGRPVRSGQESRTPTRFTAVVRPELLAGLGEVEEASRRLAESASREAATVPLLVDARAPERFEGRTEPLDRVAGHIPGAVNRFYKDNLGPDGTMRAPAELAAAFEQTLAGRSPADTIVYCGSGVTACHNLLAMEHAGLSGARLYVGSWSEWSADPERPVETGPGRR